MARYNHDMNIPTTTLMESRCRMADIDLTSINPQVYEMTARNDIYGTLIYKRRKEIIE